MIRNLIMTDLETETETKKSGLPGLKGAEHIGFTVPNLEEG